MATQMVIFTAYLTSLIHCSAVLRLLEKRTSAGVSVSRSVMTKPTLGTKLPAMKVLLGHHPSRRHPTAYLVEEALYHTM